MERNGSPSLGIYLLCLLLAYGAGVAAQEDPGYAALCRGRRLHLGAPVRDIAHSLSAQRILYGSEPLSDCSGMFHRLVARLRARCPHRTLPDPAARDTRAIARWYAQRGTFFLIKDPLAQAHLIRPGAVLFYGRSGKGYKKLSLRGALREVEHLGVVVSVDRDRGGAVVSYGLFHGRSRGKVAGITRFHRRAPQRKKLPPFGNWDQAWIGFAPLAQ